MHSLSGETAKFKKEQKMSDMVKKSNQEEEKYPISPPSNLARTREGGHLSRHSAVFESYINTYHSRCDTTHLLNIMNGTVDDDINQEWRKIMEEAGNK